MKYYLDEKEITCEEAHALVDKTGLIVSDDALTFKKEVKKTKNVKKW